MKNSKLLGVVAAVAALIVLVALLRRRLRWGMLVLNFGVAAAAKWSQTRDLNRVRTLMDRVD